MPGWSYPKIQSSTPSQYPAGYPADTWVLASISMKAEVEKYAT